MSNKTYDKIKNIIKENFKDIIIFVITILIATYQFPYYIESTGGLLETTDRVKIENSYKQKGSFNMAYVNEMPATIPLMLVALINKNWDIVKEEDVKMTTETIDEAMTRSKLYLDISLDNALLYAYTEAGKEVLKKAAVHLTPVTLELGGKSPCIVEETADLKVAAKRIVWGKFLNSSQTCVAPDYILCQKSVKEKFLNYLKAEITAQFGTNPLENPDYGKIINEKHFERVSNNLRRLRLLWRQAMQGVKESFLQIYC